MATQLKDIRITKIALVDEGCCSESHIKLFKRRDGVMTFEELKKSLPKDQQALIDAEIAKACGDKAKMEKENEEAKKEAADAKAEVARLKAANTKEPSEEELLKSAPPAIRALLVKQKAQIQAAEAVAKAKIEEEVTTLAKSRATVLKSIPGEEASKTDIFKSLAKKDEALAKSVYEMMEKANTLIEKSAALNPAGSDGQDGGAGTADSAWDAIEKAATPIAKSRNISQEAAVNAVLSEQPELYKNYLAAMK